MRVSVSIKKHDIVNGWDIWVYPDTNLTASNTIKLATQYDYGVQQALSSGESVLLIADEQDLVSSIPGQFKPVFWSSSWWWTKPRGGYVSMSVLTNPKHRVFNEFPTEEHTNWQWWDLLEGSRSIILDDLEFDIKPIVQVVDNFSRNHRLANIIELQVGDGKLLITSMDLTTNLKERLAAQQMKKSLINYMGSADFNPEVHISKDQLKQILKKI